MSRAEGDKLLGHLLAGRSQLSFLGFSALTLPKNPAFCSTTKNPLLLPFPRLYPWRGPPAPATMQVIHSKVEGGRSTPGCFSNTDFTWQLQGLRHYDCAVHRRCLTSSCYICLFTQEPLERRPARNLPSTMASASVVCACSGCRLGTFKHHGTCLCL